MTDTVQSTRNEEVVRRCVEELVNNRNAAVVDELFSPNCVGHPLWHQVYTPPSVAGKPMIEVIKTDASQDDPNYENLHATIDQMISAGDKVVTVWTLTGTRDRKQVSWTTVEIDRLVDGKIVEFWWLWDRLGLFQQLGVVPPTPELVRQAGLQL